jgi:hypothetical protein
VADGVGGVDGVADGAGGVDGVADGVGGVGGVADGAGGVGGVVVGIVWQAVSNRLKTANRVSQNNMAGRR